MTRREPAGEAWPLSAGRVRLAAQASSAAPSASQAPAAFAVEHLAADSSRSADGTAAGGRVSGVALFLDMVRHFDRDLAACLCDVKRRERRRQGDARGRPWGSRQRDLSELATVPLLAWGQLR